VQIRKLSEYFIGPARFSSKKILEYTLPRDIQIVLIIDVNLEKHHVTFRGEVFSMLDGKRIFKSSQILKEGVVVYYGHY
jgi:hypothetical protein